MFGPKKLLIALISLLLLSSASFGGGGVRIISEGYEPLELEYAATVDGVALVDARKWLGHFFAEVEWLEDEGRLTVIQGDAWSAISSTPPHAMKEGRIIETSNPPRMSDGVLLVSATFIRKMAPPLFGREFLVEPLLGENSRLVVIDPAYGGSEEGPAGISSLKAKDLLLDLAMDLAVKVKESGYDVILTRDDDRSLTVMERAAIANRREASLFLELDLLGQERSDARGFEVFYPAPREGDENPNLWRNGQAPYADRSREWAGILVELLSENIETYNRGSLPIHSPLLGSVTAPAATLSVGNISSPQEAELFSKDGGMALLTDTLLKAINTFLAGGN